MKPTGEVERVADHVLSRIMSGAYPAGLRLPPETELASELEVGRSTVREALRHLADLGVVKSKQGSGALVLDYRREGTPALLPWYVLAGRFDRPVTALARELLGIRSLLALEAVRLAVRYADRAGLTEARAILARAPGLAKDPARHAENELELFRALVCASGIWPAVWLANAFWAPMRALHAELAGAVGAVPKDYQAQMERLLDLVAAKRETDAEKHLERWLAKVDARLTAALQTALGDEADKPAQKRARRVKRAS